MASGSTASGNSQDHSGTVRPASHAGYVEDQLEKTSGEVQLLDISIAVLTMAVTLLVYLLAMSLVDHWLVPGGLGVGMRTLALLTLVVGLLFYARNKLLPYLRYKINPAFAAYTIEQSAPSLKNSVLNFLLLRRESHHVPEVVIRGVERQAATGLSHISVDSAVDHGRLIRLGVVVVCIILAGALYKVFSPKDLLPTVGRLMIPWADIDPVTRVRVVNLQPGNAEVPLRAHIEITADVKGLHSGEPVFLVYSSRGGGSVGQRVPMYREAGQRDYSCLMPEGEAGLKSDVDYRIEAGDCRSQTYRLTLVAAPSFQVQSVEYHYPPYTGLASRTLNGVGDLKAVDGTEVMIRAEASQQISSAAVNLEGLGEKTIPMDFENREAECQLSLRRRIVGEKSIPELTGYELHLTTPSGDVNENAIRHQITIIRDQPPLVEILMPEESSVAVPADGELFFQVRARDPDFRLAELFLAVDQGENELFQADLFKHYKLDKKPLHRAHRETFRFVPRAHGLKADDVVDVMAIAVDNKQPHPNRSGTSRIRVQITAPQYPPETASREATDPRTPDRQQPAENEEPASTSGEQQGGEQGAADAGEPAGESGGEQDGGADGSGGNQSEQSEQQGANGGGQRGAGGGAGGGDRRQSASDGQTGDGQTGDGQTGDGQTGDGQNGSDRQGRGDGRSGRLPADDRSSQAGQERRSAQEESSSDPSGTESEEQAQKVDNDGDAFEALNERMRSEPGRQGQRQAGDGTETKNGSAGRDAGRDADRERTDSHGPAGRGSAQNGRQEQRQTERQADGNRGEQKAGAPDRDLNKDRQGAGESDGLGGPDDSEKSAADRDSDAGAEASRDQSGGGVGNRGRQPPPPSEGAGEDRRKSGQRGRDLRRDQEPSDGGISKHDSDSAQGEEGSRHGKGEEGGGQQSHQAGEGAAGGNTPAGAGKGAAKESGEGETGSRAGDSGKSDRPTGSRGTERGDATRGEQGGSDADSSDDRPQDERSSDQSPANRSADRRSPSGSQRSRGSGQQDLPAEGPLDRPAGGGSENEGDLNDEDTDLREPGADDANLEYARETTALVLDYLQDQLDRGGIDPELKQKFGWTDDEFADFVRRYRDLSRRAEQPGQAGRQAAKEWEATLRSLGLNRPGRSLRPTQLKADKATGLREAGRSRPPQEDQERFDAFRRDVLGR